MMNSIHIVSLFHINWTWFITIVHAKKSFVLVLTTPYLPLPSHPIRFVSIYQRSGLLYKDRLAIIRVFRKTSTATNGNHGISSFIYVETDGILRHPYVCSQTCFDGIYLHLSSECEFFGRISVTRRVGRQFVTVTRRRHCLRNIFAGHQPLLSKSSREQVLFSVRLATRYLGPTLRFSVSALKCFCYDFTIDDQSSIEIGAYVAKFWCDTLFFYFLSFSSVFIACGVGDQTEKCVESNW